MHTDELTELATWFKKNVLDLSGDDGGDGFFDTDEELDVSEAFSQNHLDDADANTAERSHYSDIQFETERSSAFDKKEEERRLFEFIVGIDEK